MIVHIHDLQKDVVLYLFDEDCRQPMATGSSFLQPSHDI